MFIVELHFHLGGQLKKKMTKVEQTIEVATETASEMSQYLQLSLGSGTI